MLVTDRIRPLTVHGRTVHQIGLPFHWGPNGIVTGDAANELVAIALDPNVHIQEDKALTADIRPGRRPRGPALPRLVADYRRRAGITEHTGRRLPVMTDSLLSGPEPDPAGDAGHADAPPRVGFFTDTSVCIGCKACEVACKEWNAIPEDGLSLTGMSYDNTGGLGASTWRHVAFIEQSAPPAAPAVPAARGPYADAASRRGMPYLRAASCAG